MKTEMKRKRKWGDRADGFRIKDMDVISSMMPYILRTRNESAVMFEEKLDITETEKFVRQMRKEGIPNLTLMHVLIASILRLYSQKPKLSRYIIGRKIYGRDTFRISVAAKARMTEDGDEVVVSQFLDFNDTLKEVVDKFESSLAEAVAVEETSGNGTSVVAKIFKSVPGFFTNSVIMFFFILDRLGFLPRKLREVSPFHANVFIGNNGSIGINPVYHCLYRFGTISIFFDFGKKETVRKLDRKGDLIERRAILLRIQADHRICDGFYFAMGLKQFRSILKHPEQLLTPPVKVVEDF